MGNASSDKTVQPEERGLTASLSTTGQTTRRETHQTEDLGQATIPIRLIVFTIKRPLMITTRTCTILIAVLSLTAPLLHAQDLSRHRDMSLGSNVVAVAGAHGLSSKDAKT